MALANNRHQVKTWTTVVVPITRSGPDLPALIILPIEEALMPRSNTKFCDACRKLQDVSIEYRPRTARYHWCDHPDIRTDYAGLKVLVSPSLQKMKRLYVRDGQVNTPVGYICDHGHVDLDEPPPGPKHVQVPVMPVKWVCLATGEVLGE